MAVEREDWMDDQDYQEARFWAGVDLNYNPFEDMDDPYAGTGMVEEGEE